MPMKLLLLAISLLLTATISSEEAKKEDAEKKEGGTEEAEKTVKIGNLAFPVSQQPNPLISFGQNLLEKNQAQALVLVTKFKGRDQYFLTIVPGLLYAFTDNLSLFINVPQAVRYRDDGHHTSGPGDTSFQLEYAFYTKAYRTYYDQATVIAAVTIPTGSPKRNPPTGVGANSYFLGGTYSRMEIDWFYFISAGGILRGSSHKTKYSDQALYQFGFGRRILNTKEWLFDWMVEFDGTYSGHDKIQGVTDRNSGGNVIYITPSLWVSSYESLFFQFGIGFPVHQHLFGYQTKSDYLVAFNTGWTF